MGLLDKVFGGMIGGPELQAGSALLGYFGTKQGTSAQNYANARQAEQAMAFEERMSNTAYQRAMADMKAAGLNPMLAYSKGGASTPSGFQARMENTQAQALNSAMVASQIEMNRAQARKTSAEANVITETGLPKAQAEIDLLKRQADKAFADAGLSRSAMYEREAQTRKFEQEIVNAKSQNQVIEATFKNLEETRRLIGVQVQSEVQRVKLLGDQAKLAFNQAIKVLEDKKLVEANVAIRLMEQANTFIDLEIKKGVSGYSDDRGFVNTLENFARRYILNQGSMK